MMIKYRNFEHVIAGWVCVYSELTNTCWKSTIKTLELHTVCVQI